jgi:hypothetical protein
MTPHDQPTAFDRFRAAVLADEALQLELVAFHDPASFVACAVARALGLGIALDPETLEPQTRPDPLGIYRLQERPVLVDGWLPRYWLPTEMLEVDGVLSVGWLHFAGAPLAEPFFEDSIRRVQSRPFNRLFRFATPIGSFVSRAEVGTRIDGLIFHMSRCGSTLVAQMLAAVPDNIVVSEAPVLDALIQHVASGAAPSGAIAAMMAALTRDRSGAGRRRFIKLDSWHIFALPQLRGALPGVPWVFLYRNPVEVLVSHQRMPGLQVLPGVVPISLFGVGGAESVPYTDYPAWLLGRLCAAALAEMPKGDGVLVNYRDLHEAVFASILPHFGVQPDDAEHALMTAAGLRNAKTPNLGFVPDAATKRAEATMATRDAADRFMSDVFLQMESMRLGNG